MKAGKRLRVALLGGTLGYGGSEWQLVYLARALSRAGADVRLYNAVKSDFYWRALRGTGVPIYSFGRFSHPLLRLSDLMGKLLRFRPHIVQSLHTWTNLYAALAGRLIGAPSIGALRADLKTCFNDHGETKTRLSLKLPSAVVVNFNNAILDLKRHNLARPDRIYLLHNRMDLSRFGADPREWGEAPGCGQTVLIAGRLMPSKCVDVFLRSLAKVRSQEPSLRGLVLGDGPERDRLKELAVSLGLWPEHVEFLGRREDVRTALQQAGILVHCSDSEGSPNVILEAMASGLPVIATPAGGTAELVQPGATGYLVPFHDVESLADAMIRLARSADLRRTLGAAGRRRVEQVFNLETLSDSLLAIYKDVARKQRGGHLDPIWSSVAN